MEVKSLWDLWCGPDFVSEAQRRSIDRVEPFDEWEEFILFASHYFLLVACTSAKMDSKNNGTPLIEYAKDHSTNIISKEPVYAEARLCDLNPGLSQRRFGAAFHSRGMYGIHGGLGSRGRNNTTDLFNISPSSIIESETGDSLASDNIKLTLPLAVESRMCHTIVTSKAGTCLLMGGRASPDRPLIDCWYFNGNWRQVQNLPFPLYRHCAVWMDISYDNCEQPAVLVFGGKTARNEVSGQWLLWRESAGWAMIGCEGDPLPPIFGATIASFTARTGILTGGITASGILQPNIWKWTVSQNEAGQPLILISKYRFSSPGIIQCLTRIGSHLIFSDLGLFLIGGVGNGALGEETDIVKVQPPSSLEGCWSIYSVISRSQDLRTMLVGHSVLAIDDSLLVVGGGAVCFSFGSVWNGSMISIGLGSHREPRILKPLGKAAADSAGPFMPNEEAGLNTNRDACKDYGNVFNSTQTRNVISTLLYDKPLGSNALCENSIVPRQNIPSASKFAEILEEGKPSIIRDVKLGTCIDLWTLQGLENKIGSERKIIVHEATDKQMDFLQKNFVYRQKSLGTFLAEISQGAQQYMRSLSEEKPSGKPAQLESDFPELAGDFSLPAELGYIKENQHSSVLRISGSVNMWLHYDVRFSILVRMRLTDLGDGKCAVSDYRKQTPATIPT